MDGCNIYSNIASQVRARILNFPELSSIAPLERYVCSCGWQYGGGLHIAGTATLTNTNVYDNRAGFVCSHFELSVNFHPAPP